MKKSSYVKLVAMALFCFGIMNVTGCATIISGGGQEVTFKSEPEGAIVVIGGRELGKTPFTSRIDRKSGQEVIIRKEGYKQQSFPLATTVNGWFFGNFILGGAFGSTTDSVSGAITEYSPSFYNITLTPEKTSLNLESSEVKSFVIANYKSILEELNTAPGQYINSLWTLLKIAPEKQAKTYGELKKLIETNKDIVDFAQQVAQIS